VVVVEEVVQVGVVHLLLLRVVLGQEEGPWVGPLEYLMSEGVCFVVVVQYHSELHCLSYKLKHINT
jgi:hypothetical protein